MKKILTMLTALCLIFNTFVCFAESENAISAEAVIENAEVTISGSVVPAGEYGVTVFIYNPGSTVPSGDEGSITETAYYIGQTKTGGNGKFTFVRKLREKDLSGRYRVVIGTENVSPAFETSFFYVSEGEEESLLKLAASADDLFECFNSRADVMEAMGMKTAQYANLTENDKKDVCEKTAAQKYANGGEVIAAANGYICVKTLNMCVSAEEVGKVLADSADVFGINIGSADYISAKDSINELVRKAIPYENAAALKLKFETECAINAVNTAVWGDIPDVFERYSQLFPGLLGGSYASLTSSAKGKICAELAAMNFSTINEIITAFNNSVYNNGKKESSGGGSSGGGGGGGSKSSFSSGMTPLPQLEPAEPITKTDINDVFSDLGEYGWAVNKIDELYEKGIINGDGNGKFNPELSVTREEFVKMLCLAVLKTDYTEECNFADVSPNDWYYKYVAAACNAGVVTGIDEKNFGSGMYITRQDAAVMICRALEASGMQISADGENAGFEDSESIADYAMQAVAAMKKLRIINGMGDNRFCPEELCTRAQAAVIFGNTIDTVEAN